MPTKEDQLKKLWRLVGHLPASEDVDACERCLNGGAGHMDCKGRSEAHPEIRECCCEFCD